MHRSSDCGTRRTFLALWLALVIAACAPAPDPPAELRIAFSTMPTTESGKAALRGARLAVDEIDGQVAGHRVDLLVLDTLDAGSTEPLSTRLEREAAEKAIADPSVVAYIGPMTSGQAKSSMPLLNRAALAQIVYSATWPGLTQAGFGAGEPGIYYPTGRRHFFRLAATDDVQARVAARWAHELGFRSVFLVDNALAYGRGLTGIFEETARDLGIEVVDRASLPAAAADHERRLGEVVERVRARHPDLVFYGGGIESNAFDILARLRLEAPQVVLMGTDGIQRPGLIERLGAPVAEGLLATDIAAPIESSSSAGAQRFRTAYERAHGRAPSPLAAAAYEATVTALNAIERSGRPTRESVLDALHGQGTVEGLLGPWRFDERGDLASPTISGYRVVDGRWVLERLFD